MLLLTVAVVLLLFAVRRARREFDSYFNPWFFFLCIDILILHLLSILSAKALDLVDDPARFENLLLCSSLYIGGYAISVVIAPRSLQSLVRSSMQIIPNVRASANAAILGYVFLAITFLILIQLGTAGMLWLTDPRDAYLNYRGATGDGALFVLVQWALTLSAVVSLNATRHQISAFLTTLLLHCVFAYFTGSKQILLNLVIFALFVVDFEFHIIRLRHFIGVGLISALLFVTLLGGTDDSTALIFAGIYFSEYAVNTARIFDPEVTSNFSPGEILFSNVWAFVPRFLAETKPYEYGQVLINSVLFPGAAERGQTPGLLYWSPWYVDFGLLGVLFFGLLRGIVDGAIFRSAKSLTASPIKVALVFGASVTPIFLYAPLIYQFVFVFVASFWLRQLTGQWRRPINRKARRVDSYPFGTST